MLRSIRTIIAKSGKGSAKRSGRLGALLVGGIAVVGSVLGSMGAVAGATTPSRLVPPFSPKANSNVADCIGNNTAGCMSEINAARHTQEGLGAITLPSNWNTLSGPEQMFVFTNLERTSRGEAAIPNLITTFNTQVIAAMRSDNDPTVVNARGNRGSIWAGGMSTVVDAFAFWMYYDGPGGINLDCTAKNLSGCWGHRDVILANSHYLGNPAAMDAIVGKDSGGNTSFAAEYLTATGYGPVAFTWSAEHAYLR